MISTQPFKVRFFDTENLLTHHGVSPSFLLTLPHLVITDRQWILFSLSESLAEGGLEPLTIGAIGNTFTTELPLHFKSDFKFDKRILE